MPLLLRVQDQWLMEQLLLHCYHSWLLLLLLLLSVAMAGGLEEWRRKVRSGAWSVILRSFPTHPHSHHPIATRLSPAHTHTHTPISSHPHTDPTRARRLLPFSSLLLLVCRATC